MHFPKSHLSLLNQNGDEIDYYFPLHFVFGYFLLSISLYPFHSFLLSLTPFFIPSPFSLSPFLSPLPRFFFSLPISPIVRLMKLAFFMFFKEYFLITYITIQNVKS